MLDAPNSSVLGPVPNYACVLNVPTTSSWISQVSGKHTDGKNKRATVQVADGVGGAGVGWWRCSRHTHVESQRAVGADVGAARSDVGWVECCAASSCV